MKIPAYFLCLAIPLCASGLDDLKTLGVELQQRTISSFTAH